MLCRERLDPSLLLEASDRSIECSWTQSSAAHLPNVFQHCVSMLRAACETCQDKELRIGEMAFKRAGKEIDSTTHNVVVP